MLFRRECFTFDVRIVDTIFSWKFPPSNEARAHLAVNIISISSERIKRNSRKFLHNSNGVFNLVRRLSHFLRR